MTFFSRDFHKVSIETFKELVRPCFEEVIQSKEYEDIFEKDFLGDEDC